MPSSLSIPRTKFQAPRMRSEVLQRERLLDAIAASVRENRLTLVSAAAGWGKTTLLAQLAAQEGPGLVWVSLDEEDNDIHRFSAALCQALAGLELAWDVEVEALLRQIGSDARRARRVLDGIVNALCSSDSRRIVIAFDDFHRIDDAGVLGALDYLVERLPEHVTLVVASRTVPPLPLARLQARGQLREFRPDDLRFTEQEARRYLAEQVRLDPQDATVCGLVRQTGGWAVGLAMLAGVLQGRGVSLGNAASASAPQGAPLLFEFLAQEVLQGLAPDVQRFLLHCSVLAELSPAMCAAVSGRPDAAALLDELYRHNLFLTVVDAAVPVMRFHDLFRDFLQHRLDRAEPGAARRLNALAARAEASPSRAIGYWIAAEEWEQAAGQIARHGLRFLSEGSALGILRLIALLPPALRDGTASVQLLLGACCWMRWDMGQAEVHYASAAALYRAQGDAAGEGQAMSLRVPLLIVLGRFDEGEALLARCERELPASHEFWPFAHTLRLWADFARGRLERIPQRFDEVLRVARSEQAPTLFARMMAGGQLHQVIGLPGAAQFIDELAAAMLRQHALKADRGLEGMALTFRAWRLLWQGRLPEAAEAAGASKRANLLAGGLKGLGIGGLYLEALFAAMEGRADDAEAAMQARLAEVCSATGFVETHLGAHLHSMVRVYWMLGDAARVESTCERMLRSRSATEWPFMEGARLLARGYVALQRGDLPAAVALLEGAVAEQARYPMPGICGSAALALAAAHARQGRPGEAWTAFRPLALRAVQEEELGPILLDQRAAVDPLLALAPDDPADAALLQGLRARYRAALGVPAASEAPPRPLAGLTPREQQILQLLAAGASNKRIAVDLVLSVHTVKRHVANIIDKLHVTTRGQAAAVYHRAP